MLRLMSFLTLAVVALCFLIGAGIALADDTVPGEAGAVLDASRPEAPGFAPNLAASTSEDVYEFDDYDADVKRPAAAEPTDIRSC